MSKNKNQSKNHFRVLNSDGHFLTRFVNFNGRPLWMLKNMWTLKDTEAHKFKSQPEAWRIMRKLKDEGARDVGEYGHPPAPGVALSWRPERRGLIFCSSGCGHNCTHAAYLTAKKESATVLKSLKTTGWKASVWENLGWHWQLQSKVCGLSLHKMDFKGKPVYYCMFSNNPREVGSGDCDNTVHAKNYADPNVAITRAIKQLDELFIERARHHAALMSIIH